MCSRLEYIRCVMRCTLATQGTGCADPCVKAAKQAMTVQNMCGNARCQTRKRYTPLGLSLYSLGGQCLAHS